MPRQSNEEKLKEIDNINLSDIYLLPAKKFLYLLVGITECEYEHCLDFYDFILKHYQDGSTPNDQRDLDMILSVGGRLDKYKGLKNTTQCRKLYADEHKEDIDSNPENLVKRENKVLNKIAGELYRDFDDNKITEIVDLWKSRIILEPSIQQEPLVERKKIKHTIIELKNFLKKIINDKPQYCLGFLVIVIFITVPLLLIALSNIYSVKKSVISDAENRIQSIFITNDNITLAPGEKKNPGIAIAPTDADKSHLKHEISNTELVDLTLNWEVIGLSSEKNLDTDTAEIDIWGDDAERVTIYVTVEAEYIDRADDGADVDIKTLD